MSTLRLSENYLGRFHWEKDYPVGIPSPFLASLSDGSSGEVVRFVDLQDKLDYVGTVVHQKNKEGGIIWTAEVSELLGRRALLHLAEDGSEVLVVEGSVVPHAGLPLIPYGRRLSQERIDYLERK